MHVTVLGVPLQSYRLDGLLNRYEEGLLVFHNMDTLNKTRQDASFREVCRRAEYSVIDGQAVRVLLSLLWRRRFEKVSGSDFLPAFCEKHGKAGTAKVFLLGAGPGVADRAMQALNERAGSSVVVGSHSPSFSLLEDREETEKVIRLIKESGADTLAVGLGAPKQELWLARNRSSMPLVTRFMAVGATFDFEAGRVRRAPQWISTIGLEWAFRLAMEPRRLWRRYLLEGPPVVLAVLRSRLAEERPTSPAKQA